MNWRAWVGGRAGRREYWVYVALLFGLNFVLSYLPGRAAGLVLVVIMTLVQVRRMHDTDRSGWWGVGATTAPVVLMLGLMTLTSPEIAALIATVVALALIAVVGVLPGSPGENRFGPPAPFTWRRFFQGR
jgi:uncharacterized membrane protein YhaH (DUF805 family)